jgi:hypothetical protein
MNMLAQIQLHRIFLWIAVLAWGIGVGAKLFDLRVVAGAWSAMPPESLMFLPYGPRFPVDPGQFFMLVSPTILIASVGALATGWRTPYRLWLWFSAALIFLVFLLTIVAMWPMNTALYAAAPGSPIGPGDGGDIVELAHRWVVYDWLRVTMMAAGFICAVGAISRPIAK